MPVKWFGLEFTKALRDAYVPRMRAALIYVTNETRKALSRSQRTSGTGLKKRGLDPSKPGEYPKKVLGHLRRNVQYEFDAKKLVGRIGTNVKYGKFLETGTVHMLPRPWLSNAVRDFWPKAKEILAMGRPL